MNKVYEKLALRIAQLELDKAILQVELEQAHEKLSNIENAEVVE